MKKIIGVRVQYVEPNYATFDVRHLNPTINKISTFKSLADGWHFGEGIKFSQEVILAAEDFVSFLQSNSFIQLDAFPGFNGEIQVTAYPENGSFIEITLCNNGLANVIAEDKDEEEIFAVYGCTIAQAKASITENKKTLLLKHFSSVWITSESSAPTIMTGRKKGSQALRLDRQAMAAFQS